MQPGDGGNSEVLALLPLAVQGELSKEKQESWLRGYDGSLLFVDIAGFSNVASRLQKFTNEGAEALSFHLNGYFAKLIDVVRRHAGDIIFFSGDAMMVTWDLPLPVASSTALSCGAALLVETSEYTFTIPGEYNQPDVECTMTLHIGGVAGEIHGMLVGGCGNPNLGMWKYLLVGVTIEEVGMAASAGSNGQLVVTKNLVTEAAKHGVQVTYEDVCYAGMTFALFKSLDGRVAVAPPPPSETQRKTKLNPAAMERALLYTFDTVFRSVGGLQSGELRCVSTAFIKLTSINIKSKPKELHETIGMAVGVIQGQLAKYDGVLNKVMMDDKGVICLCLFGIPLHSHENDATRSVLFAMRAGKKLQTKVGPVSIGISRAMVFCGLTGSSVRNEYTVLGDGVNISARLMIKAEEFSPHKRHIIIDEETAHAKGMTKLADRDVAVVEGEPLVLKGQEDPLRVYHVVRNSEKKHVLQRVLGEDCSSDEVSEDTASSRMSSSRGSVMSLASNESGMSRQSGMKNRSAAANFLNFESRSNRAKSPEARSVCSSKSGSYIMKQPMAVIGGLKSKLQRVTTMRRGPASPSSPNSVSGSNRPGSSISSFENQSLPTEESVTLFGRQKDVEDVKGNFDSWLAADPVVPHSVLITGDVQIGKTEFLNKVCSQIELPKVFMPSSNVTVSEQYSVLKGVVQDLFRETSVDWVMENVDDSLKDNLPLLHHVVRLAEIPLPDEGLGGGKVEDAINELCIHLLKLRYGSQFLLVLDDLQWIDMASASFVTAAFESGLFLIGSMRITKSSGGPGSPIDIPHDLLTRDVSSITSGSLGSDLDVLPMSMTGTRHHDLFDKVFHGPNCMRICMSPMSMETTAELMRSVLDCVEIAPQLVQIVREKSDGLPGCIIDMTHALSDSGQVMTDLLGRVARSFDADIESVLLDTVPDCFQSTIMSEVDLLTMSERRVIYAAAILGLSFNFGLLLDVLQVDHVPYEAIQSALHAGFLTEVGGMSTVSFSPRRRSKRPTSVRRPTHFVIPSQAESGSAQISRTQLVKFHRSTVRDVIYKSVLARERRRLHQIAAEIMEKDGTRPLEVMANHYRKAGMIEIAWGYVQSVYKEKIETGQFDEAITLIAELMPVAGKCGGDPVAVRSQWGLDAVLCLYESGRVTTAAGNAATITFKDVKKTKKKHKKNNASKPTKPNLLSRLCCCVTSSSGDTDVTRHEMQYAEGCSPPSSPSSGPSIPPQLQAAIVGIELAYLRGVVGFNAAFRKAEQLRVPNKVLPILKRSVEILQNGVASSADAELLPQFDDFLTSPVSVAALTCCEKYYEEFFVIDDGAWVVKKVSLLPVKPNGGISMRPCIATAVLSVRCVVAVFLGDAKSAFEDCANLSRLPTQDDRAVFYARILYAYCSFWFCKSGFPRHVKWSINDEAVEDVVSKHELEYPDVFLEQLFESYFEGVTLKCPRPFVVERLCAKPSLANPFLVLALTTLLDCTPPETKQFGKLLQSLASHANLTPFASPAVEYYTALQKQNTESLLGFVVKSTGDKRAAVTPFAFRAACKLFILNNDVITPELDAYLKYLDQAAEQQHAPVEQEDYSAAASTSSPKNQSALRMVRIAKRFLFTSPEVSIFKTKVKLRRSKSQARGL